MAVRFKNLANPGDLISIMASAKTYWEKSGVKVILCQQLNVISHYYIGAVHPTRDEEGRMVCMNQKMFDMIKPLIEHQDYIERMEVFKGQHIEVDIDRIKDGRMGVNIPYGMIQQWPMLAYPDLSRDLSKPFMSISGEDERLKGKILINFTERYRNHKINYFFLKKYSEFIVFSGTKAEYETFKSLWDLDIPYLQVEDFLELGRCLKSSRFLLSNQSMQWNLAEAIKHPRVLELSDIAPNCQPFIGEDSYGYYFQEALEYYFKLLFKKTQ